MWHFRHTQTHVLEEAHVESDSARFRGAKIQIQGPVVSRVHTFCQHQKGHSRYKFGSHSKIRAFFERLRGERNLR
jgi:hypothetical protein